MAFTDRVKQAWNAFRQVETQDDGNYYGGPSFVGMSPSRTRLPFFTDKSMIPSIYTRIAIDVAGVAYRHIKLDGQGRYMLDMTSNLNSCLTLEPNTDQGPRSFRQDVALTLFNKGVAAIVPVDTTLNPTTNEVVDIYTLRVGEIVDWFPHHVRISVWNEDTGQRQNVKLEKRFVAIVENPLYMVMNGPNSTLQRLNATLNRLDTIDEAAASGKLDLIIQLPYVVKSEARKEQAMKRRSDVEFQLRGSQYGIAYVDGSEKITQLNRPAENNLLKQIEYLTGLLYDQLGITEAVMNGTADEAAMLNYFNRTIEPVVEAIVEAMQRAFVGHQGAVNGEEIRYFSDPFKLVPLGQIAEIADKFTRNEILSSNEIREKIGYKPDTDPKSDKLVNSNNTTSIIQPVA